MRTSLRMKLMSSSPGMGWAVTLVGVSVVPAMVIFSQGRKKMTRPSLVAGSSRPMLSGLTSQRGRGGGGLRRFCCCSFWLIFSLIFLPEVSWDDDVHAGAGLADVGRLLVVHLPQ